MRQYVSYADVFEAQMSLVPCGITTALITPSDEAKILGIGSSDRRSDGKPSGMSSSGSASSDL